MSRKNFELQYPYLDYWINDWGEMKTTNGDYNQSRLTLLDMGGTCYQDKGSSSHQEALEKAEQYLRTVDFPARFEQELIDEIEEVYQTRGPMYD
ncbi:MAG: hypothetical protein HC892_22600 [Saprospiraceae bacterium]|nr:hypothetical protein [Saprospiraceae bacterium]